MRLLPSFCSALLGAALVLGGCGDEGPAPGPPPVGRAHVDQGRANLLASAESQLRRGPEGVAKLELFVAPNQLGGGARDPESGVCLVFLEDGGSWALVREAPVITEADFARTVAPTEAHAADIAALKAWAQANCRAASPPTEPGAPAAPAADPAPAPAAG